MATKGKATFKHNRKHNCVTLEGVLVRGDGAVHVRAVVPFEKAQAHFSRLDGDVKAAVMGGCGGSTRKASQALAARAAVGLVQDAADFAASKFESIIEGWNPFRRHKGGKKRRPPPHHKRQAKKPEDGGDGGGGGGGGDEGGGEDKDSQDQDQDQQEEGADAAPEGTEQDARRINPN